MFKMRKDQFAAFSQVQVSAFTDKSLVFLAENFPDWSAVHDDTARRQFIHESIRLAREHSLFREKSIQRLMFFRIGYPAGFPLSEYRRDQLNRPALAEDYRLDQLKVALHQHSDPVVIRLDDSQIR